MVYAKGTPCRIFACASLRRWLAFTRQYGTFAVPVSWSSGNDNGSTPNQPILCNQTRSRLGVLAGIADVVLAVELTVPLNAAAAANIYTGCLENGNIS